MIDMFLISSHPPYFWYDLIFFSNMIKIEWECFSEVRVIWVGVMTRVQGLPLNGSESRPRWIGIESSVFHHHRRCLGFRPQVNRGSKLWPRSPSRPRSRPPSTSIRFPWNISENSNSQNRKLQPTVLRAQISNLDRFTWKANLFVWKDFLKLICDSDCHLQSLYDLSFKTYIKLTWSSDIFTWKCLNVWEQELF